MNLGVKLYEWYAGAKLMAYRFFHEEDGDVNIVSIVILIGIAVALAIFFRKQIENIIVGLFKTIGEKPQQAIKDVDGAVE